MPTLRELARLRPERLDDLRAVRGIGEKKLADLGARLLAEIERHARKGDALATGGRSARDLDQEDAT